MHRRGFFVLALLCWTPSLVGQQPPGPYPQGANPPVSEGNGVWRFDRPRGREPAFFEQLAAQFNLIKPPEPVPFGHSVAFLVGVGAYEHLDRLTHTSTDVTHMRNFLLEYGGFDTVFEVRDGNVNGVLLNTYMLNHFSKSNSKYFTARDRFLFYYSGHGGNQGDLGYLLFSKADPESGDYVTDALDMQAVRRWAYVSVARQVLMILDTCNAGLAIQPMDGNPAGGLGEDPSGILLTAGTGNQRAYQVSSNQKGYGVFTHAILETLRTGMNAQTPFMDIFEVYSRARVAVRNFEIEKGKKLQPDIDHRLARRDYVRANGNFVFLNRNPVARNSLPGKRYSGMAVQKKGIGDDMPSSERLQMARDQFDLLKNSTNVPALRIYADDYRDVVGARTWVALISDRIDELMSRGAADRPFRDALSRIITEAPTEFAHYGANALGWTPGGKWTPAGSLPDSLECTGTSNSSPMVRCTILRSPDIASAERRFTEILSRVQAALPGSGWSRGESLDTELAEHDANWWLRSVVFKNVSGITVQAQLWKSKRDGHHEVDVEVTGVARIRQDLQRLLTEAASGFANYGAGGESSFSTYGTLGLSSVSSYGTTGLSVRPAAWTPAGKWTPAGNLPNALECTGSGTRAPLVRCTMFRSADFVDAERKLSELTVQVQTALLGSDWTKDESADRALRDYDADWWQRTVVFKSKSGVTVEVQLWKGKKDGRHDVDVVVTGVLTAIQKIQAGPATGLADYSALFPASVPSVTLPITTLPVSTMPGFAGDSSAVEGLQSLLRGSQTSSTLGVGVTGTDPFQTALDRMIADASTGFALYGANHTLPGGSSWMSAVKLPDALECSGSSSSSPSVRCTMFRSNDLAPAERRLTEVIAQVHAAVPGWAKDESLNKVLSDYDADWWRRTVVFKNSLGVTVEAQLWKNKRRGYHDVDVVVTARKLFP